MARKEVLGNTYFWEKEIQEYFTLMSKKVKEMLSLQKGESVPVRYLFRYLFYQSANNQSKLLTVGDCEYGIRPNEVVGVWLPSDDSILDGMDSSEVIALFRYEDGKERIDLTSFILDSDEAVTCLAHCMILNKSEQPRTKRTEIDYGELQECIRQILRENPLLVKIVR